MGIPMSRTSVGVAVFAVSFFILTSTTVSRVSAVAWCQEPNPGQASEANEKTAHENAQFVKLSERYWKILSRNPRRGTAFDACYKLFAEAGRLEQLRAKAEANCEKNANSVSAQLLLGLLLESAGENDAASAAFQKAVSLDEANYFPHSLLGSAYARRFEFDKAAQSLKRALELKPPATEMLAMSKQLGKLQLRLGQKDEALKTWAQVARKFPRDAQILRELAELLSIEGQFDEAIERWKQVVEAAREDRFQVLKARIEIAQLHSSSGRRKTAIDQFTSILSDVKPNSWASDDIRTRIEAVFQKTNDTKGLLQYCEQRLEEFSDDLETRVLYARTQIRSGDRDAGLQTFRETLKLAPARGDIRQAYIGQLVNGGDLNAALTQCQILARQQPRDPGVILLHGEIHLQAKTAGDTTPEELAIAQTQAVQIWKAIAELRLEDGALAIQIAEACRDAAGMTSHNDLFESSQRTFSNKSVLAKATEDYYREAIRRSPTEPRYHEYLGEFLNTVGDRTGAVKAWSRIVQPPNDGAEGWHRLAEVYGQFDYLEEAIAAGRASLKLRPDEFDFHEFQLQLMLDTEDFQTAFKHVDELQRLAENEGQAETSIKRRVEVFDRSGRVYEEIDRLTLLAEKGTASATELWTLALMYTNRWRSSQAAEAYRQAVIKLPDNIRIARSYARTLEWIGQTQDAVNLYRKLAEKDRGNKSDLFERIVDLELKLGNRDRARIAADELAALSPGSVESFMLRASVAIRTGRHEDGLEILRRAVRMVPQDQMIRDHLANQLVEVQQYEEAITQYWRCFELSDKLQSKLTFCGKLIATARVTAGKSDGGLLPEIERRLIALDSTGEDRKTSAMCLAEAYRILKRYPEARSGISDLLDVYPNDIDVVQYLVSLCSEAGDWEDAVKRQRHLVTLQGGRTGLHELARLLVSAGRQEEANELWKRILLEMDDDRPVIAAIDKHLRAGRFNNAKKLVDEWLVHSPDNWRLLYRAGFTNLIFGDSEDAMRHFSKCHKQIVAGSGNRRPRNSSRSSRTRRKAKPSSAIAKTMLAYSSRGKTLPAFQEIYDARNVMQSIRLAGVVPKSPPPGSASKNSSALRKYKTQLAAAIRLPGSSAQTKFHALCGLHFLAQKSGMADWYDEQKTAAQKDVVQLRDLVLLSAAAAEHSVSPDILREYSVLNPADSLPYLAGFYNWGQSGGFDGSLQPEAIREAVFSQLDTSYSWISRHHPELKADIIPAMILRSMSLGKTEVAYQMARNEIENAKLLSDFGAVPSLVFQLNSTEIEKEFMLKLDEVTSEIDRVDPELLKSVQAVVYGQDFAKFADEEFRHVAIGLADRGLQLTRDDLQVANAMPILNYTSRGNQQTIRQIVQQQGRIWQEQLTAPYMERYGALTLRIDRLKGDQTTQNPLERRLKGLMDQRNLLLQQIKSLRLNSSGTAFWQLMTQLKSVGKLEELAGELQESFEALGPSSPRSLVLGYVMARIHCLAALGRIDEAINVLSEYCGSNPNDHLARLMLAQSQNQNSKWADALVTLDQITTTEVSSNSAQFDMNSVLPEHVGNLRKQIWGGTLAFNKPQSIDVVMSELKRPEESDFGRLFRHPELVFLNPNTRSTISGRVLLLGQNRVGESLPKSTTKVTIPLPFTRLLNLASKNTTSDGGTDLAELTNAISEAATQSPTNLSLAGLLTLAWFKQGKIEEAKLAAAKYTKLCESSGVDLAFLHVMKECIKHDATREIGEQLQKRWGNRPKDN